jgi:hypothetical protein
MVAVKLQKEENRQAFLKVFPTLADEVLAELRKYNMPEDAYEWTKKVKCDHLMTMLIIYFVFSFFMLFSRFSFFY